MLGGAALVALLAASPAALAIERHPAPGVADRPILLAAPGGTVSTDDTPLGADLAVIVFLGPADKVLKSGRGLAGVDASRVASLDDPALRQRLTPFVGRPISLRLISDIQAEVAQFYRDRNRPFVSVSTPPQEITGGLLQFRVVEFKAGEIAVEGADRAPAEYVKERIRLKPGEPVDSGTLGEDLDWLNRNPSRQYQAIFSPGASLGVTDLTLRAVEEKPWQIFFGALGSNDPTRDANRYYVGFTASDLAALDLIAAYQLTGSADFWYANGNLFGAHPTYVSHSARFFLPLGPRQQIEFSGDLVETNDPDPIVDIVRKNVLDGSLAYRAALSDVMALPGDGIIGVEAGRLRRESFLGGMSVGDAAIEVYQVFVGWAGQWYHASGRSAFQASLHYSPGGLTAANSDAAFAAFAPMRLSESQYWYAKAGLAFDCDLGGGLGWRAAIAGQATDSPLPDTEQLSIGGADAVRGYVADDGTFDTGVIARSELRLARWSSAGDPSTAFVLQPYVFADGGYAMTMHDSVAVGALSAGVGFDFALGTNLAGTVNAAHVLRDAPASSAGDWGVDFKVTGRY